jgi:hypothetical protein
MEEKGASIDWEQRASDLERTVKTLSDELHDLKHPCVTVADFRDVDGFSFPQQYQSYGELIRQFLTVSIFRSVRGLSLTVVDYCVFNGILSDKLCPYALPCSGLTVNDFKQRRGETVTMTCCNDMIYLCEEYVNRNNETDCWLVLRTFDEKFKPIESTILRTAPSMINPPDYNVSVGSTPYRIHSAHGKLFVSSSDRIYEFIQDSKRPPHYPNLVEVSASFRSFGIRVVADAPQRLYAITHDINIMFYDDQLCKFQPGGQINIPRNIYFCAACVNGLVVAEYTENVNISRLLFYKHPQSVNKRMTTGFTVTVGEKSDSPYPLQDLQCYDHMVWVLMWEWIFVFTLAPDKFELTYKIPTISMTDTNQRRINVLPGFGPAGFGPMLWSKNDHKISEDPSLSVWQWRPPSPAPSSPRTLSSNMPAPMPMDDVAMTKATVDKTMDTTD